MKDYFDFEGVRFSPKAIVFDDIRTEEARTGYFTLRNVSKRPVKITVINPKSKFFRVLSSPDHVMLSPGLKVNSGVKLRAGAKQSEELFLVIHINNRTIFYPILVNIADAQLHAVPTFLDFGTVDLNSYIPSKTIVLHNSGALPATFTIEVAPESFGLEVNPLDGTVPGKGHVPLDVKVSTTYSGVNHLYFWIKSKEVILIYVKITVTKPYLEVHHPCTSEDYTLLCFPPLYYGTQYNHTLIVRNISANDSMFAVLAVIGNEIIDMKYAGERLESYKMFTVEPMEGRMKPLEGRIFTFSFKPISDPDLEPRDEDYLMCLSVERILFSDWKGKASLSSVEWQKELPATSCKVDKCNYHGGIAKPYECDTPSEIFDADCLNTLFANIANSDNSLDDIDPSIDDIIMGEDVINEIIRDIVKSQDDNDIISPFNVSQWVNDSYEREIGETSAPTSPPFNLSQWVNESYEREIAAMTIIPTVSAVDVPHIESEHIIRIYLYGKALVPSVKLRPTEVIIEAVLMGSTADREVCLTNMGALPIHVSFTKTTNIFVTPSHVFLKPTKSVEVLLTVKPTATGHFKQKLFFALLAKTCPPNSSPHLTEVGSVCLPITYGSPAVTSMPKTIFNMGITPIITNEIGTLNERITFASGIEKPRAALVTPLLWQKVSPRRSRFPKQESKTVIEIQLENPVENECDVLYDNYTSSSEEGNGKMDLSVSLRHSKYCYKQKVIEISHYDIDRLEESLIAFPNDRSKSLRPWPKHKITRAIFTGVPRYSSPTDGQYTYTNTEFLSKQAHEDLYLAYIRKFQKPKKDRKRVEKPDVKPGQSKFLTWNQEEEESLDELIPEIKGKGIEGSTDVLIPLSPLQLFNIKVYPHTVDLGKVAEHRAYGKTICVHNFNSFAVQLHFLDGYPGFFIPTGAVFIMKPGEMAKFEVICSVGALGNYKGNIEYLVNEQHKSFVPVIAQMLPKTIKLDTDSIVFEIQHGEEAFTKSTCSIGLRNDLREAVHFVWKQAEGGAFSVMPQEGMIPAETVLFSEILYHPSPKHLLTSELPIVSESNQICILKCEKMLRRPSISLLPQELELGEIPLNITKMTPLFLQSSVHQPLAFIVSNPNPLPGVTVEPSSGILPPQGVKELQLKICFGALLKFTFTVVIKIPGTDVALKLPVTGCVISPKVKIKPEYVEFGRVTGGSTSVKTLTAENVGTVETEISFIFEEDSEFCISTSCNEDCRDCCPRNGAPFILQAGVSKTFNLLLIAKSVSSYNFTLPIVLNGMLGPPDKYNFDSFKLQTYLEENSGLYDSSMLHTQDCQETLPSISVAATVGKCLLEFSKQQFHFNFYINDDEGSKTKESLFIRNKGTEEVSLRIDCEEYCEKSPFLFVYLRGSSITREDNSIHTTLDSNEYAVFKVAFVPEQPGYYESAAAVYITAYSRKEPFCYITYDGTWMPPTIQPEVSEVFFPPVPLGIQLSYIVELKLLNYIEVPCIKAKIAPVMDDNAWNMAETITIDFEDKINELEVRKGVGCICPTVSFRSEQPVSLNTVVTFEDEYENRAQLRVVATADNCILTTHAFLKGHCINTDLTESDIQEDNTIKKPCGMLSPEYQTIDESADYEINMLAKETGCVCSKMTACHHSPDIVYYITRDNAVPFPEFPCADDQSTYAKHMRDALKAAEQWFRESGMHGTYGARIPEGLTIVADKSRGNRGQPQILFDLLSNLAGKNILSYFPTSELPADNDERVTHLHRIYIHLVLFLSAQGASIAHVRPKYLLRYDDYVVYMKTKINHLKNVQKYEAKNINILDALKFELLCTQSWLDIVLQLQKVFNLRKITVRTVNEVSRCLKLPTPSCGSMTHRTIYSECNTNASEQDTKDSFEEGPVDPLTSNVYSTAECTLLAWLGAHYSAQRQQLWSDISSAPLRTVTNFSSDLQDSLVLSAVTASHCPYLIPLYLSKVLPRPANLTQIYHNARCLCDAWETAGLGFTVTAADIVNASPPFIVGLVAHLYEFLPGVCPQATVHFNADLGGDAIQEIILQNMSKKRVTFFHRIVGDPLGLFSVDYKPGPIKISASQRVRIPVKYNARQIDKVKATIIFCGELSSPTPAHSVALNIEGKTVRLKENTTVKISVPLYQPLDKQLKIHVPYAVPNTTYEILFTRIQPTPETGMENAQPWSQLRKAKVPCLLSLKQSYLTTSEEKHTEPLLTNITCVLPTQTYIWLIFTNPNVGDFIIKLDINPTTTTPQEFLGEITLESSHCICETEQEWEHSGCTRTVAIQIPCCNHALWSAAVEILRNTLEPNEFEFWMQFTETKIGLLLLKVLIGLRGHSFNNELSPIFHTNVTYTVSTSAPKYVTVQEEITIKDTLSQGAVEQLIHVEEGAPCPLTFLLTLTSRDECEIRTYQVCIKEILSDHDFFDDPPMRQPSKGNPSYIEAKSKSTSLKTVL